MKAEPSDPKELRPKQGEVLGLEFWVKGLGFRV